MPAIVVPDLKRKFALLRAYSTLRTWPALAKPFGKRFKTLQFWQDGTDARDKDRMPDWAVPILTQLIGEVVPGNRSADELRQFVFGPAALLEEEVRTGAAVSLLEILAREARHDTATLVLKGTSIELIEVEADDATPCPRLKLGEWFRIAIRRRLSSGYPVILQHAQRAWTLLPAAASQPMPDTILVPGLRSGGEPSFMCERRDPGRHLFVCLEAAAPPPASVMASLRDEIAMDKRRLDALAEFYLEQQESKRACHALALEFEAAEQP